MSAFRSWTVASFVAATALGGAAAKGAVPDAPVGESQALGSLEIRDFALDNGMRFLVVERPSMPTVEAGWVVATGSAAEEEGRTGVAHLLEHMLFKGSATIGSRDWPREKDLLERLQAIESSLARTRSEPQSADAERLAAEVRSLEAAAADLVTLGAFSLEYSREGATRLNANTSADSTLYYVTLPREKVELWFWLESDRLSSPVFRELPKEIRVVGEEYRNRIEADPVGEADLRARESFWSALFEPASPYGRSTMGEPGDVRRATRGQLRAFFDRYYRPEQLTAVLVGAVDAVEVERLARRYFGRLGSRGPVASRSPDARQRDGIDRLDLTCDCPAQVRVRYPTVPFGHDDQFALQGLAGLLNGRAGRLYRSLVLDQGLAFAAFARQRPLRHAGVFEVTLEARGDTPLQALVDAWDREIGRLLDEPPAAQEWTRTRRRLETEHLDALKDPHLLMRRLLLYAGLGDWRVLGDWPRRLGSVTPEELSQAARRHLRPDRRAIAFYRPEASP